MKNLMFGVCYATLAQILTYMQLQGNIKYGLLNKYPVITLLSAIPLTWLYIKSVEYLVLAYDGRIWPSRLIGFGIGIIVFTIFTQIFFKETIDLKTIVTLLLSVAILAIQIFWK